MCSFDKSRLPLLYFLSVPVFLLVILLISVVVSGSTRHYSIIIRTINRKIKEESLWGVYPMLLDR